MECLYWNKQFNLTKTKPIRKKTTMSASLLEVNKTKRQNLRARSINKNKINEAMTNKKIKKEINDEDILKIIKALTSKK